MTSDDFFKDNTAKFDTVFIDGLHEYSQVRRDALNALEVINEGGWIAFHDFLPSTWKEQHVPRISKAWTGDCWKLAVELSRAQGIEFMIVKIDRGVGLMRKISKNYEVPDLSHELANAQFDRFVMEVDNLPIVDFKEAARIIG
jgi:predicted O-methyltransferase YrrM